MRIPTTEPEPMPEEEDAVHEDVLVDPLTGEILDADDLDAVLDAYERLDRVDKDIYACKTRIRRMLASLVEGDAKTHRVAGKRRKAKLTFPSPSWDQSKLKEAYHAYPELRDEFLRIESVGVKAREFKKLRGTTVVDNPPLGTLRGMILSAEREPTSPPTLTIEE